jgi:hypothetical protein
MTDNGEQERRDGGLPRATVGNGNGAHGGDPPKALVDGSNVAYSGGDEARLENLKIVVRKLRKEGYDAIVVADAALRHQIDDKEGYERRVDEGKIRQAPAGTDADYFLLAFARELDAVIVSNDLFRDRADAFPEARERMIRYMILEQEVVFERRNKKR